MGVTIAEIRESDIEFNNEHDLDAEAYSVELSLTHNGKFHLWVNGQLQGVYSTLQTLNRVADRHIAAHDLQRVE